MDEIYEGLIKELRISVAIQFKNIASILEDPDYWDPDLDNDVWEILSQAKKICDNQINIEKEYKKEFCS